MESNSDLWQSYELASSRVQLTTAIRGTERTLRVR